MPFGVNDGMGNGIQAQKKRRWIETLGAILAMTAIQTISWGGAGAPQEKAKPAAGNGEALVKQSDCTACHAVDHKVVGPSFIDVAKRYAGQKGATEKLLRKIREGGSGIWGTTPMIPHPNFTDAQLKEIVAWVLSLRARTISRAAAVPVKGYSYALPDGKTVKLNFPLFVDGKSGKVTTDVFKGYEQYNSYCYRCHGQDVTGSEIAPDLRHSLNGGMTQQEFLAVAMTGSPAKGMPSWAGFFDEKQIEQIYEYVKGRSLDLVPVGRPESEMD
jgi:cytochrome c